MTEVEEAKALVAATCNLLSAGATGHLMVEMALYRASPMARRLCGMAAGLIAAGVAWVLLPKPWWALVVPSGGLYKLDGRTEVLTVTSLVAILLFSLGLWVTRVVMKTTGRVGTAYKEVGVVLAILVAVSLVLSVILMLSGRGV